MKKTMNLNVFYAQAPVRLWSSGRFQLDSLDLSHTKSRHSHRGDANSRNQDAPLIDVGVLQRPWLPAESIGPGPSTTREEIEGWLPSSG